MPSASDIFSAMPTSVDAAAIADMDTTIQFDLSGEGGGTWNVTFADGKVSVNEGGSEDADLKLSMDATDFVDMTQGNLNPMQAFMGGKIKLDGDMGLAMKLQNLF
ncbi:MAG: SCP2 sterol-binding domain-containing protein [Chloroflexota bacterium]